MSDYKSPDELIRELVNALLSAEADLIALRQVDHSGRTKETLKEIERVKELTHTHKKRKKPLDGLYPLDLFNRRL